MSKSKYSLSEIAKDMKAKPEHLKFSALLERIIKANMIIKDKEHYFPAEAVKAGLNKKENSFSNDFKDFGYIKKRLKFYYQNLDGRFPSTKSFISDDRIFKPVFPNGS